METYQIDRFIKRVIQLVKIIFLSLKDIVMFITWPVRRLAVNMTNVEVTRKLRQLQEQITEIRLHRLNDRDWDTNNPHKHDNYQSQIDGFHRKVNELLLNDEAYNKQFNRLEKEVNTIQHYHIDNDISTKIETLENDLRALGINWSIIKELQAKIESLEEEEKNHFNWRNNYAVRSIQSGKDRLLALEDDYKYLNGRMDKLPQNSGFVLSINASLKSLKAKVDKLLSENSELTFKPLTKEEEVEMSEGEAQWYKDGEEHYKRIAKDEYAEHKANYPDEPNFNSEKEAMDKQIADVKKRDEEWEQINADNNATLEELKRKMTP